LRPRHVVETIDGVLAAILNPAGGLRYHWRARRYERGWGSFVAPLAEWLAQWDPDAEQLLLVGPSAGWCLPDALFGRFARIDVLEPDPIARVLLARRVRRLGRDVHPHERDYLTGDPARIAELVRDFPDHAMLFSNVLGQVRYLRAELEDDERNRAWKQALTSALDGRVWATFHDRRSGPLAPRLGIHAASDVALADEDLVAAFYDGDGELITHATDGLFPDLPRRYFAWELIPGRHHLVEAIRHR
jgi:hypothetical protein